MSLTVWANSLLVMYEVYFLLMSVFKEGLESVGGIWETRGAHLLAKTRLACVVSAARSTKQHRFHTADMHSLPRSSKVPSSCKRRRL